MSQVELLCRKIEADRISDQQMQELLLSYKVPFSSELSHDLKPRLCENLLTQKEQQDEVLLCYEFHVRTQYLDGATKHLESLLTEMGELTILAVVLMSGLLFLSYFYSLNSSNSLMCLLFMTFFGADLIALVLTLLLRIHCRARAREVAGQLFYFLTRSGATESAKKRAHDLVKKNPRVYECWGSRIESLDR